MMISDKFQFLSEWITIVDDKVNAVWYFIVATVILTAIGFISVLTWFSK